MAEIADVIAQVQSYLLTLDGMRQADALPPNSTSTSLASVCYPHNTHSQNQPNGGLLQLHELLIEISVPEQDLARDVAQLLPFVRSVPRLLFQQMDPRLSTDGKGRWGGLVESIGTMDSAWPPHYKDGDLWRRCVQFTVHQVKILDSLT